MRLNGLRLAAVAVAGFSTPAVAHHSFAMFDSHKNLTVQGIVKDFEWSNPHVHLRIIVSDKAGALSEWELEMGPPAKQAPMGWKADSLRPGDKVSVMFHPYKDGSPGGQAVAAILPNGKMLRDGDRTQARGDTFF